MGLSKWAWPKVQFLKLMLGKYFITLIPRTSVSIFVIMRTCSVIARVLFFYSKDLLRYSTLLEARDCTQGIERNIDTLASEWTRT